MIKIKLWAVAVLAALGLAVGPTEASAAYPWAEYCNYINSRGPIKVYGKPPTHSYERWNTVTAGNCVRVVYTQNVRIDPDPELGADVGSTWWGFQGQGYDYCRNGEAIFQPPAHYSGYIIYNTDASGC